MSEFVADRDALVEVLHRARQGWTEACEAVDAILASGIVQGAADVRRAVAEEIAAAIEAVRSPEGLSVTENLKYEHAARIAREVGDADV